MEADFELVPLEADVVFAFLSPATLQRLRPRLAALPANSRVVTTGAAQVVPHLLAAAYYGTPITYVESVARLDGPSVTGRLAARLPHARLLAPRPGWAGGWTYAADAFSAFVAEPASPAALISSATVALGSEKYPFPRAIRDVARVLGDASITWQVGNTPSLDGVARNQWLLPGEMDDAMADSSVVITHGGAGSILTALAAGLTAFAIAGAAPISAAPSAARSVKNLFATPQRAGVEDPPAFLGHRAEPGAIGQPAAHGGDLVVLGVDDAPREGTHLRVARTLRDELRHLDRRLHRQVAQAADDQRRGDLVVRFRATQATERGLDHFRVRQTTTRVERRTEADLRVADVLERAILRELVRDPLDGIRRLHQRERDVEAGEVVDEVAPFAHVHVLAERGCIAGGQRYVADLEEIKRKGVLRVITRNSSTSYFLHRGAEAGFNYELAKLLADELGVDREALGHAQERLVELGEPLGVDGERVVHDRAQRPGAEAMAATLATAGVSIVFSGLTVAVGLV